MALVLQKPVLMILLVSLVTLTFAHEDYFWYLNDLHYDPSYGTTMDSCITFIPPEERGNYGNGECDAPWLLVESVILAMAKEGRTPKFIIWAGDTPPHPVNDTLSTSLVLEMLQNATTLLRTTFPDIPVYPVLGNHDYYPSSQLPTTSNIIYEGVGDMWKDWIDDGGNNPQSLQTFKEYGYYTKVMSEVDSKVRAIVLNTNLYFSYNRATEGQTDPAGQFTWLESELQKARDGGEKVHIMIHMPPSLWEGPDHYMSFRPAANARFNELMRQYGDVILGIFAAHTHTDSFRIFYKEDTPRAVMFLSPAVTPWRAPFPNTVPRNPAVRRYKYDRNTHQLKDYDQFYLKLSSANSGKDTQWKQLYTFHQNYGVNGLTAPDMHKALESFTSDDSNNFHRYYKMNNVDIKKELKPCGCDCKQGHICAIGNVDKADFDACQSQAVCGACGVRAQLGLVLGALLMHRLIKPQE